MPLKLSPTAINELQNRPRQDITGDRYGNTLSDDMFSIKNPTLPNRHTPESYEYFNQPTVPEVSTQTWEPAAGWNPLPVLNPNLVSRQKFVGEKSTPLTVNKEWGLTDDILEFPDDYSQEQIDWATALRDKREAAQRADELSTEGLRGEKFGDVPTDMSSYRDAEWDPYLGAVVNYNAMSPRTMEQLAKMGVNRPSVTDDRSVINEENGNDTYNSLLELYRLAIQNGWR